MDIALAAMKLAHQVGGGDKDQDDEAPRPAAPAKPKDDRRDTGIRMARMYIGAGRLAGILPQNIVGAITGESGIKGHLIGAIEICDKYSLVELPDQVMDDVIRSMRNALMKGKKVTVRRFVEK
jgi:ATP-dependent RNA helicase DeaD